MICWWVNSYPEDQGSTMILQNVTAYWLTWHSIQKTWILRNTATRTPNLTKNTLSLNMPGIENESIWQHERMWTVTVNMITMCVIQEITLLHVLQCGHGVTRDYSTTTTCTLSSNMIIQLWRAFFMVKRYESHMAISLGCTQDVWAPPVTWNSVGPEICGLHRNVHWGAAGWCHQWVYHEVFFLTVVCSCWNIWQWKSALTVLLHYLKSRSRGALMSFWFSLDGFTTW
jgi:hypothetical protein